MDPPLFGFTFVFVQSPSGNDGDNYDSNAYSGYSGEYQCPVAAVGKHASEINSLHRSSQICEAIKYACSSSRKCSSAYISSICPNKTVDGVDKETCNKSSAPATNPGSTLIKQNTVAPATTAQSTTIGSLFSAKNLSEIQGIINVPNAIPNGSNTVPSAPSFTSTPNSCT